MIAAKPGERVFSNRLRPYSKRLETVWKTLSTWLLAFFNMARELQENRTTIRQLEHRIRDVEEAVKLLAQELRHSRELDRAEREKLLLRIEREGQKALPPARGKKKRR